jgi:antitoxin component of MazEF toxin-antitoxin module
VIENQKNIERTGFTSPQRLPKTLFQSLTDLNSQDVEINFSDDEHIILPTQKKHKV